MSDANATPSREKWYRLLTGYHWFVLIVCTAGWAFDTFDQQLFNLARQPAIRDLLGTATPDVVNFYGGLATAVMLVGWATGGIVFGIMGDKIGRAKTMVLTVACYSLFTGLSALSFGLWDFLIYRFIAGLGIGGQFGLGTAIVAETLPDRARPHALGFLQAFSAVGNISAGLVGILFSQLLLAGYISSQTWRWMFGVGILPAVLIVFIMLWLKEPERWKQAVAEGKAGKQKAGSLVELFGDPRWRVRAIVGIILAAAGVIGLWGIGVFGVDLVQSIFRANITQEYRKQKAPEQDQVFVALVFKTPEAPQKVSEAGISPRDLIGKSPEDRDAQYLLAAALTLAARGEPVTVENALRLLDQPWTDDGSVLAKLDRKRQPQTAEDRERRRLFVMEADVSDASLADHIARIQERTKNIGGYVQRWGSIQLLLFNIGAFFGIYAFSMVTDKLGRKWTFALFFLFAMVVTAFVFLTMRRWTDVLWMAPLMGFAQLSVFGGYAIYFPELFPTRLRSTGTSMCYNIGRYVSAFGPFLQGYLSGVVFANFAEPMRVAGATMCLFFLLGILVLPLAPETKDQPLPE
ncbi:Major facilitator superfamily (MFS) transport protein [Thermogutta terrifontis]|uniref:Major facilitator superfamily (MFS) transport protein n=1 Tax=Thermogutta terrifontis TaxID=1331910 RepID=A0A286RJK7_9BACT|nr:MFS transporter [Thermogutta terrifontis]ASV76148.1 Major facilitator superfamily (MFS) transport protein [Thermogutta terrifontis]